MMLVEKCPICGHKPLATMRGRIDVERYHGAMRKVAEDYFKLGGEARPEEVVSLCSGCRAVWRAKFFDTKEVEAIYGSLYRELEAKLEGDVDFAYDNEDFMRGCARKSLDIVRRLEARHGVKLPDVFDVGGRDGFRLTELAKEGYRCAVFDPIDTPVRDPRIRKRQVWSHEIPAEEKADVIFLCNVLEHSIDPFGLVRDCHAHLKDGGFLYVELPSDIETVFDWLIFGRPRRENLAVDHTHYVFYSRKSVHHLLSSVGFGAVESRFSLLPVINVNVLETVCRKGAPVEPPRKGLSFGYDLWSSGHFGRLGGRVARKLAK